MSPILYEYKQDKSITTGLYTVRLSSQPSSDVTVAINCVSKAVSLSQSQIVFNESTWHKDYEVDLLVEKYELGHRAFVQHSVGSNDVSYLPHLASFVPSSDLLVLKPRSAKAEL